MSLSDFLIGLPSNNIVPSSGSSIFIIILIVVDFPAPFGPNNPNIWPFSVDNDMLSTANRSS